MAQYTISHSEDAKGWTSFYPYIPDWFARLGNRFYTIKNGQLWQHHDTENPVHGNYYGVQYGFSATTVFNENMADDKAFRAMVLESDQKWDVALRTNYTEGSIAAEEFNTRESRQFSFIRRNEESTDYHGGAAQGVGVIQSVDGLEITFGVAPKFVNIGDVLKQVNGPAQETIGTVTLVQGNVITVDVIDTAPSVGFYAFAQRNARVEGSDIRGYYMEVTLSTDDTAASEIFAIGTENSKSYV